MTSGLPVQRTIADDGRKPACHMECSGWVFRLVVLFVSPLVTLRQIEEAVCIWNVVFLIT